MLNEKPIDTAPRDGSAVMLWCDDGVWRTAAWQEEDIWVTIDGEMRIKGTREEAAGYVTARIWAPLVAPPAIAPVALGAAGELPK